MRAALLGITLFALFVAVPALAQTNETIVDDFKPSSLMVKTFSKSCDSIRPYAFLVKSSPSTRLRQSESS